MLGELVVAFIYGGLAGLMGTVMARSNAQEQVYMRKILELRSWMKARGVSDRAQGKAMESFHSAHNNHEIYDQQEIFVSMPTALAGGEIACWHAHLSLAA